MVNLALSGFEWPRTGTCRPAESRNLLSLTGVDWMIVVVYSVSVIGTGWAWNTWL